MPIRPGVTKLKNSLRDQLVRLPSRQVAAARQHRAGCLNKPSAWNIDPISSPCRIFDRAGSGSRAAVALERLLAVVPREVGFVFQGLLHALPETRGSAFHCGPGERDGISGRGTCSGRGLIGWQQACQQAFRCGFCHSRLRCRRAAASIRTTRFPFVPGTSEALR